MNEDALIRLENLKALNLTAQQLSERVGGRVSYWSDLMRGKKSFGEKVARKIEEALEMPRGYMDAADEDAPIFAVPEPEPAAQPDVMQALEILAGALSTLDDATRAAMAPLLSMLAREPEQTDLTLAAIGRLLTPTNLAHIPQDVQPARREITSSRPSLEQEESQGHAKRISDQRRGRT